MRTIRGSCHCGNISYEFQWPLEGDQIPVRACSCSFCTKHRGTYTSHPEARLEARVEDASALSRYTFATGTAEFFVCARCGVVPLVTSPIDGTLYAVVNVNTFEPVESLVFETAVADFDGEETEGRLARRKRTWIADVRIDTG